jgi:predicted DNA-binding transcriptional regulator AlpA
MVAEVVKEEEPKPPNKAGLLVPQSGAWVYLGIPRSTWFRLRSAGKLPDPVNVPGSGLYWRRADLDKWAAGLKPERKSRRRASPSPSLKLRDHQEGA